MNTAKGSRGWWLLCTGAALALGAAASVGGVGLQAAPPDHSEAPVAGQMARLLLDVPGVTCGSCEGRIREALEARPGVAAVAVDLARKTVTVEYVAGSDDPKALADAVTRSGYPARFRASGPAVAPARTAAERPRAGCGGDCCAGG
jgi:Cu+-exporting ATPase